MEPQQLTSRERWQIVAFLRTLLSPNAKPSIKYPKISISENDIRNAGNSTDSWLTYSGTLHGERYSKLTEINPENVAKLKLRWTSQFDSSESNFQATPIVAGGRIFISQPPSNVIAFDAKSGAVIWQYQRNLPSGLSVCCARTNRGLAILGNTLFLGTLDGHLLAIDADTGNVTWDTIVADFRNGYTLTGAPLIANNLVIVGAAGGDYGARGFLAAYDPATGQQRWRFQTIPEEGSAGHESWAGDSWRRGGGATWATGSYDPELNLVYWGVGNPAPDFVGDVRKGDNLFTNSVIALNASSGMLAWHFQFTPHDEHDWDSAQTPILADSIVDGAPRKLLLWFNRNGFYYVLDRVNGKFLLGTAFVNQNWAKGLDATGRPILSTEMESNDVGRLTRPGVSGAANWQPFALDKTKGLAFVQAIEGSSIFTKSRADKIEPGNTGLYLGSSGGEAIIDGTFVRALDITRGTKVWEYPIPKVEMDATNPASTVPKHSGLLATAGGLVFGASGGYLFAFDTTTGKECWRVYLGGETQAPPISFEIAGHQVIAASAGRAFFVFEL
jgi:alcohol dehydrogenase (cytochrome c)